MNGTPAMSLSRHAAFIKTRLPAWLTQAPAPVRSALRDSLIKSDQARHELKELLRRMQSPQQFAQPLLRKAIRREFAGLLDADKALLSREWKHHHLLGLIKTHAGTTEHTLLEAALQNFEASDAETGGMEDGTQFYTLTRDGRQSNPAAPERFARICRTLDLGRYYQAHLEQVLGPTYTLQMTSSVRRLFVAQEKNAFEVELHLAHLQGTLGQALYQQLLSLAKEGRHPDVQCNHLTLDGVILPNVLVIEARTLHKGFILYTPQDPLAPLRLHLTLEELDSQLALRLSNSPEYLAFFTRLVPLRHQPSLLKVKPAWADWYSAGATGKIMPISMERVLSCSLIRVHLFLAIARERIAQIKSDARVLAVPTEDADLISQQKRRQAFLDFGQSLLFFAASFVPIVGEMLMLVSAAQLVNSVYHGFAAWSRGDSEEALNDLLDVVDDVAQAVMTAGAVKTVGFTAGLVKVKLRQGGERLWKPDLAPYRHTGKTLPGGLPPDAQGLFTHDQQHYLKLDDHLHAVERDPKSQQWQLQHPSDPQAYRPSLLSNGAGGWRLEHETPQDWDALKLVKRLGPDAATITAPQVEPLLLVSGVDSPTLRQLHQDATPPPPLLRDTLRRFNLEQEIKAFDAERAEGSAVTPCSPFIQLYLVCSLPEWPSTRQIKIVDGNGVALVSLGGGSNELRVPQAVFERGDLLHYLERQIPASEFNELLPASPQEGLGNVENLALRLEEHARQHQPQVFAWLNQMAEKPGSAPEQELARLLPELPPSHRAELAAVLTPEQKERLRLDRFLTAEQHWEADQYLQQVRAGRARESLLLDSTRSDDAPAMALATLEQLPGWPTQRRLEVRDNDASGPLLASSGAEDAPTRHVVTREGTQYRSRNAQGQALHEPTDLAGAIEQTLSPSERDALLLKSQTPTLKQALRDTALQRLARPAPATRAKLARGWSFPTSRLIDPAFADPAAPTVLNLRADGIYQTPEPAGGHHYYALEGGRYYRVQSDTQGWQLVDIRSPFRPYRPYIRKRAAGGWELDENIPQASTLAPTNAADGSSGDEFVSADSASDYESADEGKTCYTSAQLRHMRSNKDYQDSQNYKGIYNAANNGRYPLRDVEGAPMRIRSIQALGTSERHSLTFSKDLVMPYLLWQGYEKVAALYDAKVEVVPFTAAHQKFPQESSLIGQSTVVTKRAIRQGEALGVYGGEYVPEHIAAYRQDPYLLDTFVLPRAPKSHPAPPPPRMISRHLAFSGDNVLSRINTLFEYENNTPVRQASSGYNVIDVGFIVDTQVDERPRVRLRLTALFAAEDLEPFTELRWNYGYDEEAIGRLFPAPSSQQ